MSGFMEGVQHSNAAKVDNDPNSLMRQWRHDDEDVAYPTFELIQRTMRSSEPQAGLQQHLRAQGTLRRTPDPLRGHRDLPKAARDWPKLNFITYHACIQPKLLPG